MRTDHRLLPCPFCDGKAEIIHVAEGENAGGSCVCCTQCLASSNIEFEFKENFVSNWNRRALPKLPGEGDARPKVIATMKPPLDTAGHSPLPWRATGQSGASIYDANGMYVAMHVTLADRALIIEAVNASTPTNANAEAAREPVAWRDAARRYMLAVKRLGEQSGYNRLTFFEAPISKMPNDELGMEAVRRWQELNNAGKALTAAVDAPPPATGEARGAEATRDELTDQMIRSAAVGAVDATHGFTFEFSSSPQAHCDEYDIAEIAIRDALKSILTKGRDHE